MASTEYDFSDASLPTGRRERVIPFGLARGISAIIDFEYDSEFYFGTYERELNPYFERYVRTGTRVFDIGGHRGWDSLIFARLSGQPVVTFEVDQDDVCHMRESFARNQLEITIDCRKISDHDGPDSVTIDTAVDEHFAPDFIKMDIEGDEVKALRGAARILQDVRPAWVIEVQSAELGNECESILRSHNYETRAVHHSPASGPNSGMNWLISHPRESQFAVEK